MSGITNLICVISKPATDLPAFALNLIKWLGGLSLSTILFILITFFITFILRRKGYGVRLGLACLVIYARPGSRRFPDGCEVRITTRMFGFFFTGCRGPVVDISADRFYMRLRSANSSNSNLRLPKSLVALLRYFSLGVAAVDRGYWSTLTRNLLTRFLAFLIRGLRIRVQRIRIWKDGGSWEFKAEQFVFAGYQVGIFGSKYSLSVNELYVNVCKRPIAAAESSHLEPVNASLVLRHGVEIVAYLTPRLFTLLRPRRMAIMDDLRITASIRDISCKAAPYFDASITHIAGELCPGYSRGLKAKLPSSAPTTSRPRKPGFLRYWEGNGAIHGLTIRFVTPTLVRNTDEENTKSMVLPISIADQCGHPNLVQSGRGSESGLFLRTESIRVEAYGKATDERSEAMTKASVSIKGCSAGSSAVDALSRALYETASTAQHQTNEHDEGEFEKKEGIESIENVDKIVAARPEALVWIEDISAALDVNCSKRHSSRVDVGGSGAVLAIEPVGLVNLLNTMNRFLSQYRSPTQKAMSSSPSFLEADAISDLSRTASDTSLQSSDLEPMNIRFGSDFRSLKLLVLGHGPVGDGDTMAIVVCSEALALRKIDIFGATHIHAVGSSKNFEILHWSQWACTKNVRCREVNFDICRGITNRNQITLNDATIDWDVDFQSGLQCIPFLFANLKQLKEIFKSSDETTIAMESYDLRQLAGNREQERVILSEHERKQRRERRHTKLLRTLGHWDIAGSNVSVIAAFPDGPRLGISVGNLPRCTLDTRTFVGYEIVVTMQDKKCAYATEMKLESPLHTLNQSIEKRRVSLELHELVLVLYHDFQFGFLLQDWLLRFRSAMKISKEARLQRRGIPPQKTKQRPFPDIHFKSSSVEIYFEDHPLAGFYTRTLPLFQDESRERFIREQIMESRIQQLEKIARAEIAGTAQRCIEALRAKNSEIWIERVKRLKEARKPQEVANGHLPSFEFPPAVTFTASDISFDIVMDDLVRQNGSSESIRRLKMLDDYELGSKKYNKRRQHDSDAWNSIGFRNVFLEANDIILRFRDFPVPFATIDHMHFDNTIMGQAIQATLPPYVSETTVGIGKRRLVHVVKGLGPTKTYADIHLVINELHCGYNPSYLSSIADFGKGISRFFGGGKNPSPRIPWFDSLRVNMHGRMRITAHKLKGHLTSSVSPYSVTKHFAEIEVDNFEMLASRLEATKEDPFPIIWKLYNWHIRPYRFGKKLRSEVVFDFVRVGLNPVISVLSGDPQDHYFVPFPSKEEVAVGGPGIGKGTTKLIYTDEPVALSDNGFGNFTEWKTGLHDIPEYDSFRNFKTDSMVLGIDILVRHPKATRTPSLDIDHSSTDQAHLYNSLVPPGASVLHSDAITTLIKVIKTVSQRPISCRLPPRRVRLSRKPPSRTGLSSTLRGLQVRVDAEDLNVMFFNNLEEGHALFISIGKLMGELWKKTEISRDKFDNIHRDSKMTRRRFNISEIYSSIRVPNLDLAVDSNDMGKLLTIDKISLSDEVRDERRYVASPSRRRRVEKPTSGFGKEDLDTSPFYTFSSNYPLQRGKKLDKVQYDKKLLVDRVRLIWSPMRRISVFAWPDAFKEKSFCMKTPKSTIPSQERHVDTTADPNATNQAGLNLKSSKTNKKIEHDSDGVEIPKLDLTKSGQTSFKRSSALAKEDGDSFQPEDIGAKLENTLHRPSSGLGTFASSSEFRSSPSLRTIPSKTNIKPAGSMVDLLAPYQSTQNPSDGNDEARNSSSNGIEVLRTRPRVVLLINDCQVVFGSPETRGYVFLASKFVSLGIVDKNLRKSMQLGQKAEEWSDREYRVHLNEANLLTRTKTEEEFDFNKENWVPEKQKSPLCLITRKPICMDLMFISSSSPENQDEFTHDDHILRPKLLFINIPDISLSTNADEFHSAVDVVRKVLMQKMRSSEIVNEELASLRYNLQLAGEKVSSEQLSDFMRRLDNVTRQFLYAGDTFQEHLVESLKLPDESPFGETLQRYKAKAKALATYTRQDQRASSTNVLYPIMYVSYSFDKCSWELRENHKEFGKETEDPFVEISLQDLVCRHIFYVGQGSSTEMTFANIGAQNKMRQSYFQGILQPATVSTAAGPKKNSSQIKASDGATVAFRWYCTQEDRVGGIQVYDLLTIQVAPMTTAVTRKLFSSVAKFIFSSRSESTRDDSREEEGDQVTRTDSRPHLNGSSNNGTVTGRGASTESTRLKRSQGSLNRIMPTSMTQREEVNQMAHRGESNILFRYVFIDAFELTASFKHKETETKGMLDFSDLFVTTPSFSYSSQVWTWREFSMQLKRDLLSTLKRRGVSSLVKIKLLPGYTSARKRLVRGADSFRESIISRLPSATPIESQETPEEDANPQLPTEVDLVNDDHSQNVEEADSSEEEMDESTRQEEMDAAIADIASEEGRRKRILGLLYGDGTPQPVPSRRSSRYSIVGPRNTSYGGSESSVESYGHLFGGRPPKVPSDRARSTPSHGSVDDDGETRPSFFARIRRRANERKHDQG